jgi:hypothetical protein
MKKIIALLFFLFPCALYAQGTGSSLPLDTSKLLENCCLIKKQEKEQFSIGEMKSSSEEFRRRLIKQKRIQLDIIPDDVGSRKDSLSLVKKPGRFYGIEYKNDF